MKKGERFILLVLLIVLCFLSLSAYAREDQIAVKNRLEKAKSLNLELWVDEEGYLIDLFYKGKSDQILSDMGLDGLIRTKSKEELDLYVENLRQGISNYAVTRYEKVSQVNPTTGRLLYTGVFEVDGKLAFCIQRTVATPAKGAPTGEWEAVSNEYLRKVLYYGYNGPEEKGFTYVETALAAGEANGDGDNALGRTILAAIKAYDSPPDSFKVWKVKTNDGNTQDLAFYTIEGKGYVQIQKVSSNPAMTEGNSCYSVQDAVYGIYQDEACLHLIECLTTDEKGITNSLELAPGNYYVKEISAPKGYLLNETVEVIQIVISQTTVLTVKDKPIQVEPKRIIQKVDQETNETKPQGNREFQEAKFLVQFYGGDYENGVNPGKEGKSADKEWLFQTDENGAVYFSEDYKVSGDDFWKGEDGQIVLPLGTVVVTEKEAPKGYFCNLETFVKKLSQEEHTWSFIMVNEEPIYREVHIRKIDEQGKELKGAEFTLYSDIACKKEVKKGITNEKGSLFMRDLAPNTYYYLKETKAPEGYKCSKEVYTIYFDGTEENQILEMKIVNKKDMSLPNTGSKKMMFLYVIAMMCFIKLMKRRRMI